MCSDSTNLEQSLMYPSVKTEAKVFLSKCMPVYLFLRWTLIYQLKADHDYVTHLHPYSSIIEFSAQKTKTNKQKM